MDYSVYCIASNETQANTILTDLRNRKFPSSEVFQWSCRIERIRKILLWKAMRFAVLKLAVWQVRLWDGWQCDSPSWLFQDSVHL